MLPFGVIISASAPQWSEIPEGIVNYPVLLNPLYPNGGWRGFIAACIHM
jgi:hypothetical protein